MSWKSFAILVTTLAAAFPAVTRSHGEIRYDLTVLDEAGRPLEGASIWYFGDLAKLDYVNVEDMRRLVQRHHRDVDFIFEKSLLGVMLIEKTRDSGQATVLREWQELEGVRTASTQIAVLKHGRIPEILSRTSRLGAREKITVTLRPDPSWPVDPRLELLDHLRASMDAVAKSPEVMTTANQRKLAEISAQLRQLARELEDGGRPDDAAAVYYSLAHMPGVTLESGDGMTVRGYSNGFDAESPQRVADRARAWQLVKTHPAVAYEAVLERFRAEGIVGGPSPTRDDSRSRFLAETRQWLHDHSEQLWPRFHYFPALIHGLRGDAEHACDALRELHEFAPAYFKPDGWRYELRMSASPGKSSNLPSGWICEIPGLPASTGGRTP